MKRFFALAALMSGVLVTSCCGWMADDPAADVLQQAGVHVAPTVLEQYAGTYRLASGAHLPVVCQGDRLLGGTPPHELLAQTTRQFSSNQLPGEFHFERTGPNSAITLRRRTP